MSLELLLGSASSPLKLTLESHDMVMLDIVNIAVMLSGVSLGVV